MRTSIISKKAQTGASVTGVVMTLIVIAIGLKLAVSILPAQIGNYQVNQVLISELKHANEQKLTADKLMQQINKQMSINSLQFDLQKNVSVTNTQVGDLALESNYEESSVFFGNVFIVNRFNSKITAADAKQHED